MPAIDTLTRISTLSSALGAPFSGAVEVTPSDSVDLTYVSYLWIGAAGNLKVTMVDGSTAVFTAFSGWLPGRVARVWATGTTATGITAAWP